MRQAKEAGVSVPDIAADTGLSTKRVYQVLAEKIEEEAHAVGT